MDRFIARTGGSKQRAECHTRFVFTVPRRYVSFATDLLARVRGGRHARPGCLPVQFQNFRQITANRWLRPRSQSPLAIVELLPLTHRDRARERRPRAHLALNPDPSTVQLDELPRQGQTESSAFDFLRRRPERVLQTLDLVDQMCIRPRVARRSGNGRTTRQAEAGVRWILLLARSDRLEGGHACTANVRFRERVNVTMGCAGSTDRPGAA